MSTSATQTEVSVCNNTSWTQIDTIPLVNRGFVEILNNDTSQGVGVLFISDGTTPSGVWNSGRVVLGGGSTKLMPLSGNIKIFVMTQTGGQTSGAAIVLCEWGG